MISWRTSLSLADWPEISRRRDAAVLRVGEEVAQGLRKVGGRPLHRLADHDFAQPTHQREPPVATLETIAQPIRFAAASLDGGVARATRYDENDLAQSEFRRALRIVLVCHRHRRGDITLADLSHNLKSGAHHLRPGHIRE